MQPEKLDQTSDAYNPVDDQAVAQAHQVDPALFIEPKLERKLVRKIDAYMMSIMGLLYLMCFLDRANIGA